jgi:TolB-like protein
MLIKKLRAVGWKWWAGSSGWVVAAVIFTVLLIDRSAEKKTQQFADATTHLVDDLKRELDKVAREGPTRFGPTLGSASRTPRADRISIAVLNFTDLAGAETKLGSAVSAELSDTISRRVSTVTLVNRQYLIEVLDEQDLSDSGRISKSSGARVGKILGAEYLLTGEAQLTDDRLLIVASLVHSTTGETRWTRTVDTVALPQFSNLSRRRR